MKKQPLYIILFAAILATSYSCSDFLDVNTDPNNPASAPYKMVLPAAEMSTAGVYGNYLMTFGSIWAEHFSQNFTSNQYNTINDYNPTFTEFNWMWSETYSGALNDYKYVLDEAEKVEDWNMYLVATCMQAFHYAAWADLFDKIPYSEALQGTTILTPKYDDGQAVYTDLLARIDAALAKELPTGASFDVGTSDYVFQGDMDSWKAFANTLKLKMYLRLTNTGDMSAKLTECLNSSYGFVTQAMIGGFSAEAGKRNPFYGVNFAAEGLGTDNFRAADVLLDLLKTNGDLRYNGIYVPGPGAAGAFNSRLFGSRIAATGETQTHSDLIARGNWKTDDPVYFFTEAMVQFMIAEAKERTGVDGKANYDAGILASFLDFGRTAEDAALVADAYAYPAAAEDKIEAIITQKWIASATRLPIEGWFDYNRTGYPDFLKTSANSQLGAGQMPKRFHTPQSEMDRNANAPAPEAISKPVWWAK